MKQARRTARQYFEDFLQCCDRIQEYVGAMTLDEFLTDHKTQDAIVRNVEILGEASHQLLDVLPDAATRFPDIPFSVMYSTRNRLIHGYSYMKPPDCL